MKLVSVFLLGSFAVFSRPVDAVGGNYDLLNKLLGQLSFKADTSHINDVTVKGPVNVDVYIRLPKSVSCSEFGVQSVNAIGAFHHDGKEDDLERYDLGLEVDGLRFKCYVPLCIKTSLPLNDWDCEGSVTLESTRSSGSRISLAQMLLSPDFSQSFPVAAKAVPAKCEARVKMDGVKITVKNLKRIVGVDVTPLVQDALSGNEKDRALDPIRKAVCVELDNAAASIGKVLIDNPVVRFANAVISNSTNNNDSSGVDSLWLEREVRAGLAAGETLFDMSNNIITRVLLPPKDGVVEVALDNPVVVQVLSAINIPESAVSDTAKLFPALFTTLTQKPLPLSQVGGDRDFDLLKAAKLLLGLDSGINAESLQSFNLSVPNVGEISLTLDSLTMNLNGHGLGESLRFKLFGQQTVGLPEVELEDLRASAHVSLKADIATLHVFGTPLKFSLEQGFRVDLQVGQLILGAALLLAVDVNKASDLELGPLMAGHWAQCALSAFHSVPRITQLKVAATALSVGLSGFTDAIGVITQDLVNAVMPIYMGRVPATVEMLINKAVEGKPLVDDKTLLSCPAAEGDSKTFVDFSKGLVHKLSSLVDLEKANALINKFHLEKSLDVVTSRTELLMFELPQIGGLESQQLAVALHKLSLHLKALDDLALFDAKEAKPQNLHSRLSATNLTIKANVQLDSFKSKSSGNDRRKQQQTATASSNSLVTDALMVPGQANSFELSLSVGFLEAALDILVTLTTHDLAAIKLRESVNLDCWIGRLASPSGGTHNSTLALANSDFGFKCLDCDSRMVREISERLSHREARADLAALVDALKERWLHLVHGRFEPESLQQTVNEARRRCESNSHRDEGFFSNSLPPPGVIGDLHSDQSNAHTMLAGLGLMLLFFSILIVITNAMHPSNTPWPKERKQQPLVDWLTSLTRRFSTSTNDSSSIPQSAGFWSLSVERLEMEGDDLDHSNGGYLSNGDADRFGIEASERVPLWVHPRIPRSTKLAMPILILFNVACFIYGHLGYVIRISIIGTLFGGRIELANLVEFSVVTSTQELWEGGAIALAMLISVFSIVWPYLKLVLLALCWFTPEHWLSFRARGKLLHRLDIIGKWSMIELFVVAFVLIFLNIPIDSPDATISFLPRDLFTFQLAVLPQSNLYIFIVTILLSLVLGNFVATQNELIVDRALVKRVEREQQQYGGSGDEIHDKLSIVNLAFLGHDLVPYSTLSCNSAFLRRSKMVHGALLSAVATSLLLTLVAASRKVLRVEILGLVGRTMDLGGSASVSEYSLFSFVADSLSSGTPVGQMCLAFVILLVSLVLPLAQLGLMGFMAWPGKRHSLKNALHLRLFNQALCAFSALEVFLLGVGVSVLELGMLTRSLLADQCDGAQHFITEVLFPLDLVSKRDAQAGCFALEAKLLPSLYWFLFAVFASNLVNIVIAHFALEKFIALRSSKNANAVHTEDSIEDTLSDIGLDRAHENSDDGGDASVQLILASADNDSATFQREREHLRTELDQALLMSSASTSIAAQEKNIGSEVPPPPPPRPPTGETEDTTLVPSLDGESSHESAIELT